MKSLFLAFVLSVIVCEASFAQTQKKKAPAKKAVTTTKPAAKAKKVVSPPPGAIKPQVKTTTVPASPSTVTNGEKTHTEKFYERVGISYFGIASSSRLGGYHADYASINRILDTPTTGCERNCDDIPQNIWSQLRFDYNFGGGRKFLIAPRWTTAINPGMHAKNYKNQAFILEDAVVGFQLPLYNSADGKFSWQIRPIIRLPMHMFNRPADKTFGGRTYQPDVASLISYTFNDTWNVFWSMANRFWVYEDRYTNARHRVAHWAQLTQKITDKGALTYGLNWSNENTNRYKSINGQKSRYRTTGQDYYFGYYHDITPKFNLQPYVGAQVMDSKFSLESWYAGMYIGYTFK